MAEVNPTNSSGLQSVQALRTAGTGIAKEFVCDRVVRVLWELPNITAQTAADEHKSIANGNAEMLAINSSEIVGFTLDANDEAYSYLWLIPQGLDVDEDIDFSILWSNSEAAATGNATFTTTYTPLTAGTTAIAVGSTALDTVHTADVDLAANVVDWCPYGTIDGGTLSNTPGDDLLAIKHKVTLDTIANATIYKGRVRYYRKVID